MANSSMQMSRSTSIQHLLRDVALFGGDAGRDFVGTNLNDLVREAVAVAVCKLALMHIPVHGFGKAAIQGMAQALRVLTGLEVDVSGKAVRLVWARPAPEYV
ncbi:hypothetical protein MKK88_21475 [Methylobacterium sp. E-005]|uniref:hypothetical protein n=1 Tax=Methylobacterium sp. E-005 TaxID=2836549 RepID=UPI001FBA95F4|nr:hypothetical protein [Methylobacterium sp. E-005]MCJ2088529.1 hypothetical protein [Methylobacterium sp. E-005]